MEFRVFFPVLNRAINLPWLAPADLNKFVDAVENIAVNSAQLPEVRMDSYFLGKPYFGLKYRHGEKLEIKVRDKNIVHGIEKWAKTKLGKKGIDHYKEDIHELLSSCGYHVDVGDPDLSFQHQVAVQKSRHCFVFGDVMLELCQLEVPREQPDYNGPITYENWLSVAVEGSQPAIEAFLASKEDPMNFKASIRSIGVILAPSLEHAAAAGVVPVVSGYPMFVRYLAGKHSAEELAREIVPTWSALVQRVSA